MFAKIRPTFAQFREIRVNKVVAKNFIARVASNLVVPLSLSSLRVTYFIYGYAQVQ